MRALIAVLLMASLAGCVADEAPADDVDPWAAVPEEAVPASHVQLSSEPAAGSPQEHGTAEVVWGETRIKKTLDGYTAYRTGRIDNDFGGASAASVTFSLTGEDLVVEPSPDGDYHYIIEATAWAPTEDMAKDRIKQVGVDHQDGLTDEGLVLSTSLEIPPTAKVGPVSVWLQDARVTSVTAQVPTGPLYTLTARGGDDITVSGIDGPQFVLRSQYGPIKVSDGSVEDLWVDGYDGVSVLDLAVVDLYGKAGYGDVTVERTEAWDAELRTGSGEILLDHVAATTLSAASTSGPVTMADGAFTDLTIQSRDDVLLERVQARDLDVRAEYGDITASTLIAPSIAVAAANGAVDLHGVEASSLSATARSSNTLTITDADADTIEVSCGYGDASLQTVAAGLLWFDGDGDLELVDVHAPQAEFSLGSGTGSFQGLRSDAAVIRSASADLVLAGLAVTDLQILSSSGDIGLHDVESDVVSAQTASGGALDVQRLLAREVTLVTDGGGQTVQDLTAERLTATGGYAALIFDDLSLHDLTVDTDGGDVHLSGALRNLTVQTRGGDAEASVEALGGTWSVEIGAGEAIVQITDVDQRDGYDVTAKTDSGEIDVGLPDMLVEEPGEGIVHAVTLGFEHRAIQTFLEVTTTSGDITIDEG